MMATSKWPANIPDLLQNICSDVFIKHLNTFVEDDGERFHLKPGISLQHPVGLCDKVFESLYNNETTNLRWLNIFNDNSKTRLSQVNLAWRRCSVNDLEFLVQHPIVDLDLSNCQLTKDCILIINKLKKSLRSLKLNNFTDIVEFIFDAAESFDSSTEENKNNLFGIDYVLDCPNLRRLHLRTTSFKSEAYRMLKTIVCPLKSLSHLDLSMCNIDLEQLDFFDELPNLVWLNLNRVDIENLLTALQNICKAKKLRHLDLSGDVDVSHHEQGDKCLEYIIQHLPCLTSLDISCTNLAIAAKSTAESDECGDQAIHESKCSIAGLEGRQFEFLGLLDCVDDPSNWSNLPAKKVAGNGSEEQILWAARCYVDREYALSSALAHLFLLFRYQTVKEECEALECILAGMEQNASSKDVQISGSAALYYIVKGNSRNKMAQKQKQRLLLCLIAAMKRHTMDVRMIRNGCLTIYHMDIPSDVMFCYEDLVKLLIYLLSQENLEDLPQRICITLLNHFASIGKTTDKILFGDWGGIEAMLGIISTKLSYGVCDEIMEVAWSAMWNITDETKSNCERFIDGSGLCLFRRCLTKFPEKSELWRNMMGLMGNIAEVKSLRPKLMHPEFVPIFSELLESDKDGIEVSYNATGIFSHMMADGPEAWTILEPTRAEIVERMITAIERWPLDSARNINYRSFCPILGLVTSFEAVAAQYWAVWALCNLTKILPDRYCEILKEEGGVELLQELLADPRPTKPIKDLARMIIDQVEKSLLPTETEAMEITDDDDDASAGL